MIQPYPYASGVVAEDGTKEQIEVGEEISNVRIWQLGISSIKGHEVHKDSWSSVVLFIRKEYNACAYLQEVTGLSKSQKKRLKKKATAAVKVDAASQDIFGTGKLIPPHTLLYGFKAPKPRHVVFQQADRLMWNWKWSFGLQPSILARMEKMARQGWQTWEGKRLEQIHWERRTRTRRAKVRPYMQGKHSGGVGRVNFSPKLTPDNDLDNGPRSSADISVLHIPDQFSPCGHCGRNNACWFAPGGHVLDIASEILPLRLCPRNCFWIYIFPCGRHKRLPIYKAAGRTATSDSPDQTGIKSSQFEPASQYAK